MRNEKGQALPLAMMALTIGALIIAPFLGHVSSSVISSHTYSSAVSEQSASDAGVEHAIWGLTYGTLDTQIPNTGDHITYQLGETLNGVTPTVTVTTNATGSTAGTINKTIIDTLIFGPSGGNIPAIIRVAGNVYAIVYSDSSDDGWVKTVTITPDGMIADTAIDTLEFDTSTCYKPVITLVSGNYYAIVYRGASNRGWLKTVSITAAGDIGNSVTSSYNFDTTACYEPDIIRASGTYYAIAYRGYSNPNNPGYVKTISISTAGVITKSIKSSLTFDTTAGYEPDIIFISGVYYAIAYRGSSNLGTLKTISISSTGIIGTSVVSAYTFNANSCYYPHIIQVSGSVYAISYTGASPANGEWWGGILTTVNVSSTGLITKSIIDEIVFDPDDGDYSDMVYTGNNVYAIVYTGGTTIGVMKTISIAANGTITNAIIDTLTFDNQSGFYPRIIAIDSDTYAVAYTGSSGWVGILKTIGIYNGTGTAAYTIVSTAGGVTISALVNTTGTTSTIVSWKIQ